MFKRYDWFLILAVGVLALAGLLTLAGSAPALFQRQIFWYFIGFISAFFVSKIDWRWLAAYSWLSRFFYGFVILLLIAVYFFAPSIRNVRSWLVVGPIQFQPVELAKLALIFIYAGFFARRHFEASLLRNLFFSFLYLLPILILVFLQPDLGSALILLAVWISFVLASGVTGRQFIAGLLILSAMTGLFWFVVLETYQKDRILSFLTPEKDSLGINYNVIQSKIAIGSAGFFGKGFGQGTQVQLGFLPETSADFIFAAFVEEWGMAGGIAVISAFFFMVWRIVKIGLGARGNYAKFICLGAITVIILHFFLNIGSNLGFSPVVGLTFPFFSYGGSSLLTLFILLGIIQNIAFKSSF